MPMKTVSAIVVRGCVDVPDLAAIGAQREIELQNLGFGARSFAHMGRCHVGQSVELVVAEAERLIALGILREL
jgi:hypothetical protein